MQEIAYLGGEFIPVEQAKISIMTHAFNYGTGAFEGIRAYWNPEEEQLYVFRMSEHFERLRQSTRILALGLPLSVEAMSDIAIEILRRSRFREDVYLRPIAYKSGLDSGVGMTGIPDDFLMYAQAMGPSAEVSLRCCVSSWRRTMDNAIPPRAKATGGYMNVALAKHEAITDGYDEAIMLAENGSVAEGITENLFIIKNRTLITPAVNDGILEGITRASIIEIARNELGMPTVERTVQRTELYTADEVFLCATRAQVSPVVEIDRRSVGSGTVGALTLALQRAYMEIVRGSNRAYDAWLHPVYPGPATESRTDRSPASGPDLAP